MELIPSSRIPYYSFGLSSNQLVSRNVDDLPFLTSCIVTDTMLRYPPPDFDVSVMRVLYGALSRSFRLRTFLVLGSMEKGRMDGFGAR
jgi:hypothetical protein